jgi:inward rectifier potassium channel
VFWRAFFFSVETFATIGYGEIAPVGVPAHVLVVVESFVSIVLQALATGFVFARFARPSAALRFSRDMVVAPYGEGRAVMFRLVNTRQNEMIDLRARVMFSARDASGQGMGRRFARLALERESVDLLPLAWTVVHPITESSPLWGMDEAAMRAQQVEFLVLCSGVDDTVQQAVYTRTSYRADEVVWGARFSNMYLPVGPDGRIAIDVRRLNAWVRVPLPDPLPDSPPAPAPHAPR